MSDFLHALLIQLIQLPEKPDTTEITPLTFCKTAYKHQQHPPPIIAIYSDIINQLKLSKILHFNIQINDQMQCDQKSWNDPIIQIQNKKNCDLMIQIIQLKIIGKCCVNGISKKQINTNKTYKFYNLVVVIIYLSLWLRIPNLIKSQNITYGFDKNITMSSIIWSTYANDNANIFGIVIFNSDIMTLYNFNQKNQLQIFSNMTIDYSKTKIKFSSSGKILILGATTKLDIYQLLEGNYYLFQQIIDLKYTNGQITYSRSLSTLVYEQTYQIVLVYSLNIDRTQYQYFTSIILTSSQQINYLFVDNYGQMVVIAGINTNQYFYISIWYFDSNQNKYKNIQYEQFDFITSIDISGDYYTIVIGTNLNILIYKLNLSNGLYQKKTVASSFYSYVSQIDTNYDATNIIAVFNKSIQIYKIDSNNLTYSLQQTISYNTDLSKSVIFANDSSRIIITDQSSVVFWSLKCPRNTQWNMLTYKCELNCSLDPYSRGKGSKFTQCSCINNYSWNSVLNACAYNCLGLENSFQVNLDVDRCRCKNNSIFLPNDKTCQLICSQAPFSNASSFNTSQCNCLSKYVWNRTIYNCVLDCSVIQNSNNILINQTKCGCNSGYQWSFLILECKTIPSITTPSNYILIIIVAVISATLISICSICLYRRYKNKLQSKVFIDGQPSSMVDLAESKLEVVVNTCSICLESSSATKTNCGHFFHFRCIVSWCQKHPRCPNCNNSDLLIYYKCKKCENYNSLIQLCDAKCKKKDHQNCHKQMKKSIQICNFCVVEN